MKGNRMAPLDTNQDTLNIAIQSHLTLKRGSNFQDRPLTGTTGKFFSSAKKKRERSAKPQNQMSDFALLSRVRIRRYYNIGSTSVSSGQNTALQNLPHALISSTTN